MTYEVLIRKTDGRFTATVLGLPDCKVEAPSRSEAIQRAREAVSSLVADGEIVQIEIPRRSHLASVASFVGMWAEDETFEEFVEAMAAYRREIDSDPAQP